MMNNLKSMLSWASGFRRRSLLADTTAGILAVSVILALAITMGSLVLIRNYETQRQLDHVDDVLTSVASTVSIACFVKDNVLAGEIAKGLLANPAISAVRIKAGKRVLVDEDNEKNHLLERHAVTRTVFSPFDTQAPVGEIQLVADSAYLKNQAIRYSNLSIAVLLLEMAAVFLVVATMILRKVIRPIEQLSAGTHIAMEFPGRHVEVPPGNEQNELGRLTRDVNTLIDNMSDLLSTEQALHEKAMRSERDFRTLAENMPDIIARYDRDCRRVFVNPAYVRQTGTPLEVALNSSVDQAEIWRPKISREEYKARLHKIMETGEPDHILLEWVAPSGEAVSHEMYVVAEYDSEGRIIGTLAIGRDITQRKAVEQQLMYQATHDVLTGLPNRVLLKDRLGHALQQAQREGGQVAVIFVDLDNFKTINDTLGHELGDVLLKTVAARMGAVLRASDTVARLGGDEFVILLQEGVSVSVLDTVARKVFNHVGSPCEIGGHVIYTNTSMGIAMYPQDGEDIETLMRNADTAMYAAKSQGRNNYQFFSAEMNSRVCEWMEMSTLLREALEQHQFSLHYQPKVDLRNGSICGMEALIRWQHPIRGWIPPSVFIPVAEECGMIQSIGEWVLEEACRQMRAWLDAGVYPPRMAVNLSAAQCRGDEIQHAIQAVLHKHALDGQRLEVEITESIVMHDTETATRTFWNLRDIGVHVTMDDFGTGYSSLSYLKKFPVKSLKIDKSFVDDIEHDANDQEIICAIIAMAHSLGLVVIAEGVETKTQLNFLRRAGCDQIQGYFFSKPVPAADLAIMLKSGQRLSLDGDIALSLLDRTQHSAQQGSARYLIEE